jgi:hypothetical protein
VCSKIIQPEDKWLRVRVLWERHSVKRVCFCKCEVYE